MLDQADSDGFHYSVSGDTELWWKPCDQGYNVKVEPNGSIAWIGEWDTAMKYLSNELTWENIAG